MQEAAGPFPCLLPLMMNQCGWSEEWMLGAGSSNPRHAFGQLMGHNGGPLQLRLKSSPTARSREFCAPWDHLTGWVGGGPWCRECSL